MSDVPGAIRLDAESFERSGFLREAGEALFRGDAYFRASARPSACRRLHHQRFRPHHLLQRSRRRPMGASSATRRQRMVRVLEALLAGWQAAAPRSVPDGAGASGEASRSEAWKRSQSVPMGPGCRSSLTRRRCTTHRASSSARSTCWSTSPTASAPSNPRSVSPRSSSSPTTPSSPRISMASSPAGIAARNGYSATRPGRRSADRSPSSFLTTGMPRNARFSAGFAAASTFIMKPSASARTGVCWIFR